MPEIRDATTAEGGLFGFLGIGAAERCRPREKALAEACIAQLTPHIRGRGGLANGHPLQGQPIR
ncbi:hypothetical protein [Ensifer sp. WSM1721]|uniref:hypothetical protein n=1 Tax=Ensifer sp. WSM1721 TaxID=1041159 RepID=UPI000478C8B5|nr:hypothetical protein [Ensifer sp. WSM1721]